MDDREKRIERQKQNALERAGTNEPVCSICGESHWSVFEKHHIAGRRYSDMTVRLCKNCHAKATGLQHGHPPHASGKPTTEEIIGRLLLNLADFFELLIESLRKFGMYLIEMARNAAETAPEGPKG